MRSCSTLPNIRDIRLASKGLMGLPQHFLQDEVLAALERLAKKAFERGVDIARAHARQPRQPGDAAGGQGRAQAARAGLPRRAQPGRAAARGERDHRRTCSSCASCCSTTPRSCPYYFYMCDMIPNSEHWRISVAEAQQLPARHDGLPAGLRHAAHRLRRALRGQALGAPGRRRTTARRASRTGPRTTAPASSARTPRRSPAATSTTIRSTPLPESGQRGGGSRRSRAQRHPVTPSGEVDESASWTATARQRRAARPVARARRRSSPRRPTPSGATGAGSCAHAVRDARRAGAAGARSPPRSARAAADRRRFPAGHHALLPVAHGPGPPALPGAHAGHPGAGRGDGCGRASWWTRSARTAPAGARRSSTSTRTGCCCSRTDTCAVYCRHCTRRRHHPGRRGGSSTGPRWREAIGYVRAHPEVRDVLVSGGDPLLLSDERLEAILEPLRAIPHVEMLRVATRAPVCLPMRVTDALARAAAPLRAALRGHPLQPPQGDHPRGRARPASGWSTTGCRWRTRRCCCAGSTPAPASSASCPTRCLRCGCGPTTCTRGTWRRGTEHLRTPLGRAWRSSTQLRGHTSGLAVPHLAVDLPGGGGKVTLQPDYVVRAPRARDGAPQLPGRALHATRSLEETDCRLPLRRGVDAAP